LRIKKRLSAVACAVVLAGGLAVASAPSADASNHAVKTDVTNRSVTCNDIVGKLSFTVPLTLVNTIQSNIPVTMTMKSTDCVDNDFGVYSCADNTGIQSGTCTNPDGATLKQWAGKGYLTAATNSCTALAGLSPTTGHFQGKFSTVAGTRGITGTDPDGAGALLAGWTKIALQNNGNMYGGVWADGGVSTRTSDSNGWGASYGFFRLGPAEAPIPATVAPVVTGAYSDDGGASFEMDTTTALSIGSLLAACTSSVGLKSAPLGIGGFTT
jgi:hypothetical protein